MLKFDSGYIVFQNVIEEDLSGSVITFRDMENDTYNGSMEISLNFSINKLGQFKGGNIAWGYDDWGPHTWYIKTNEEIKFVVDIRRAMVDALGSDNMKFGICVDNRSPAVACVEKLYSSKLLPWFIDKMKSSPNPDKEILNHLLQEADNKLVWKPQNERPQVSAPSEQRKPSFF